jgi:hypothetical protein
VERTGADLKEAMTMATILETVKGAVHDTAKSLIDNKIPTKLANFVSTTATSGFGIVGDALQIVVDLTAKPTPPGS